MMVFSGMKHLVISPYFYIEVPSSPITDKKARVVQPLLSIYQDLGLSDQEAKQLNYNLRLQHALANGGKTIKEMYNEDSVKGTSSCNNAKENYKKLMEQRPVLLIIVMLTKTVLLVKKNSSKIRIGMK